MLSFIPATTLRRGLTLTCLGAAVLGSPLIASAQTMAPPVPHTSSMARRTAYSAKPETLDQRIASLHAALKITPTQEADWAKVAEVMRSNDSDMRKLVADREARVPHQLSAVDDLKTYQSFAQAHVDGLKDLVASFEMLYAAMPDDQKMLADHVFAKYARARVAMHRAMQAHS